MPETHPTPDITVRRRNENYDRRPYFQWGSPWLSFITALMVLAMLALVVGGME